MYYLNYYSKHLLQEEQQKLVHLKSLSSVAMEQGSAIHHLIEVSLRKLRKGNPNIDIARLENYVDAYAHKLVKQRQFFDMYYKGIEVRAEDISDNVLAKFKIFANSEVFEGLAKDISERLKHPYYWAGMCHYGAGANIEHKKSRTLWYGLLVFILGATGIFLYKRKSN